MKNNHIYNPLFSIQKWDVHKDVEFLACRFYFPDSDHVVFSRENTLENPLPFIFLLVMYAYVRG